MENQYWVEHAKKIEELKNEHLFICFSKSLVEKCDSRKQLLNKVKEFNDLPPIDSFGEGFETVIKYGDKSNYGNTNLSRLTGQLYRIIDYDEAGRMFTNHSNDLSNYLKKVLYQESKEELESFWDYLNSLKKVNSAR